MKEAVIYEIPPKGEPRMLAAVRQRTVIGKSPQADLPLDDLRCEGIHAMIEVEPGEGQRRHLRLIDLGSHYGTYLNGRKIREAELKPGDRFQIGSKVFRIEAEAKQAPPAPVRDLQTPATEPLKKEEILTEKRLLQVTHFWGETSLDVRTFPQNSKIHVGSQRKANFHMTLSDPRFQSALLKLSDYEKGNLNLCIPPEATGLIWIGSEVHAIDTLRHRENTNGGDLKVTIRIGDRAFIQFGEMSLLYEFVAKPERIKQIVIAIRDKKLLKILASVLGFWLLLFTVSALWPQAEKEKTLEDIPEHLKQVIYDAGIQEALKKQQAAIGQIAKTLDGGRARAEEGKSTARKSEVKPQVQKSAQQRNLPKVDQVAQAQPKSVQLDSAFAALSETTINAPDAVTGPETQGNVASALASGGFARGTKGLGAGGGGQSVGIGQLTGQGTGGGMGAGDYGLAPSKGQEIKIREEEEIVMLGALDPEVIAAIIRRYLPQIQHCYEQQLVVKPKLRGKVVVSFLITGDGGVKAPKIAESSLQDDPTESCILQKVAGWSFPKPKGGGTVGVKYPFLLMSNTGGQ